LTTNICNKNKQINDFQQKLTDLLNENSDLKNDLVIAHQINHKNQIEEIKIMKSLRKLKKKNYVTTPQNLEKYFLKEYNRLEKIIKEKEDKILQCKQAEINLEQYFQKECNRLEKIIKEKDLLLKNIQNEQKLYIQTIIENHNVEINKINSENENENEN
jgi:hypothetical protein